MIKRFSRRVVEKEKKTELKEKTAITYAPTNIAAIAAIPAS